MRRVSDGAMRRHDVRSTASVTRERGSSAVLLLKRAEQTDLASWAGPGRCRPGWS